uniref:Uncharacterized protein MANES_06G040600 n=1 Tax=Rhizophora mucronata TaxID=61149 RepID=A0A2P2KCP6_RHIMU
MNTFPSIHALQLHLPSSLQSSHLNEYLHPSLMILSEVPVDLTRIKMSGIHIKRGDFRMYIKNRKCQTSAKKKKLHLYAYLEHYGYKSHEELKK